MITKEKLLKQLKTIIEESEGREETIWFLSAITATNLHESSDEEIVEFILKVHDDDAIEWLRLTASIFESFA